MKKLIRKNRARVGMDMVVRLALFGDAVKFIDGKLSN